MTYYRRNPSYEVVLRSDIIEDRDVQILDIMAQDHPRVRILHIYNDPARDTDAIIKKTPTLSNHINGATIITRNWNLVIPF
jgi:hypothetical protein